LPILADADGKHSKEKAGLLAKTILVEGIVQRVGFRRFVESTARRFHIAGFVKNLKDGAVQIFAQSSQANSLDDFIKEIESNAPKPIQIDKLEINEAKPRPSFKRFVLITGPLIEEMIEEFGSMESQFRDYRESSEIIEQSSRTTEQSSEVSRSRPTRAFLPSITSMGRSRKSSHRSLKDSRPKICNPLRH